MHEQKETWRDVEACTMTDAELSALFDAGFGSAEGKPFTLWTKRRVYFPVEYDGSETVRSVARNPDEVPTEHISGRYG